MQSRTLAPLVCALGVALSSVRAQSVRAQSTSVDLHLREGTNIAAAVSPDGRTIAFDLIGRIWVIPRAGGAATALTGPLEESRQPAWSPDGARIAFQSYRDGTWHIYSMARDGSDIRQHTFGALDDREPDYTADGQTIVFSSDRAGNYDIWSVDLARGALTRLTDDPADDAMPAVNRATGAIAFVSTRASARGLWSRQSDGTTSLWVATTELPNAPAWSPDGTQLSWTAFGAGTARLMVAARGAEARALTPASNDVFPFRATWLANGELLYTGDGQIRVVSNGSETRPSIPFDARVTFTRTAYTRRARDFDGRRATKVLGITGPAISPDARSIVFAALGDLWLLEVCHVQIPRVACPERSVRARDDTKPKQLTRDPFVEYDPAWSPDGKSIVYSSDRSGTMELWLRDVVGNSGADRALTTKEGGASLPAWSPNGRAIVYQVQRGLATEIKEITVAAGEIRRIRANLFQPSKATFSADGSILAVAALKPNSARYREGRNDILLFDRRTGGNDRWLALPGGRGLTTRGTDGPVWSPDGRRLAFILDGVLVTLPIAPNGDADGPVTRHSSELANTPAWSGDGRVLMYQGTDGLRLVNVATGAVTKVNVPLTWLRRHPPATRRIVVHAGRLWDGLAAQAREAVDVVIVGHRIASVQPHTAALHRDSVVDASQYTVMPGLADAHAHEGFGVGEALGRTWLSWGITTVRDPASEPFQMRERREAAESGVRVGPRALSTGRIFDGERIYYGFNNAMTPGAQLQQELERAVAFDFSLIKTYVRLPDALQSHIISFAHANGIPVSSHELYPAVASGSDHVEHIGGTSRRGYSPKVTRLSRSYGDVAELLIASGMSLTPTVALQGGYALVSRRTPEILDDPRLAIAYGQEYVEGLKATARRAPGGGPQGGTPEMVASLGALVTRVVRGGGRVMAGTDSPIIPFGLGLHVELQNYVEGGLTPREALMTATSGFAKIVGLDRDLGSIVAGKLADLVAVEGNPLEQITDTRRVRIVVKNGEVYTRERLLAGPVGR
ncbi:MAG: amidohydrolase family protein [Gemmatimonadaceae bacterium]